MPVLGLCRRALTPLLVLVTALALPVPGAGADPYRAAVPDPGPTRILLLGDSGTHGSAGDWTWRYRLWRHLERVGASTDFVGPRDDLHGDAPQAYAEPDFDRDHASRWGMFAGAGAHEVAALMRAHAPDVVVVALGINDFLWSRADQVTAADVTATLGALVGNARSVDPGVDVVLSELTQTWLTADGRAEQLNAMLPDLAAQLTSDASRVTVARSAHGYTIDHTYDGSHPSPDGELLVAASVADALAALGVGSPAPRPVGRAPAVPRPAPQLRAVPGNGKVRLTWEAPPGATSVWVWMRDRTAREAWRRLPYAVPVERTGLTVVPLRNYHRFQFRVQARRGEVTVEDVRSPVAAATPRRPPPGEVRRLRVVRKERALSLRWRRPARATSYRVTWRQQGRPAQVRRRDVVDPAVRVGGLRPGRRYVVSVVALNDRTPGPRSRIVSRTRR